MKNQVSTIRQTLAMYWQHARVYPKQLGLILGAMPLLQLADDFATPFLTSKILNQLAQSSGALDIQAFIKPLALILVIELCTNFFWRPYIKVVWRFEENVMRDLYNSSFRHLMDMSYRFYSNRFSGSLVSQVNKFVGSFERLSDTLIWQVYKLCIAFVFTVVLLVRPAPLYVLVLVSFTTVYLTLLFRLKRNERPLNESWAAAESYRTGQLADSIGNILAVKAFAHEDLEADLFSDQVNVVRKHSLQTMRQVMHNEMFTTTAQRAINAGAILTAILLAAHGTINIGTVYLVLMYTISIIRRLWDMNNTIRNMNRIFGDAREMTDILRIDPEIADKQDATDLVARRGSIKFDKVTFAYPEQPDQPLFKDFTLRIKPGEKVGLVGHSGSGKTSLTTLILRYMDVSDGTITIDDQDISTVRQQSLRSAISYVPQEPLMFHRTISDNIRYGQLSASDQQVAAAAKMANADEFIRELQHGYDTLVGERGTKLSGGQRQRIAIARAMIKNAPILLLDEATSALDSESEGLIQEALWNLMEGRTAIVIAHRLSTIQKMDRIIVLDKGKIIEEGTHKELVRKNGMYAALWSRQSGGFIEE